MTISALCRRRNINRITFYRRRNGVAFARRFGGLAAGVAAGWAFGDQGDAASADNSSYHALILHYLNGTWTEYS